MKTKTYNIIKQATLDGRLTVPMDVTVKATSKIEALKSIGAENPTPAGRVSAGISCFRDANGWTYLLNINA